VTNDGLKAICDNLCRGDNIYVVYSSSMFSMGMAVDQKTGQPVPQPMLNRLSGVFESFESGVFKMTDPGSSGSPMTIYSSASDIALIGVIGKVQVASRLVQ